MKNSLYFLILLFLVSCTSNTIYKKPENLIPKDTMLLLLSDMYIASSAKHVKNKFSERNIDYMFLIHKKYKIDSLRFGESNVYYASKIEEYNEMIKEVKKRLEHKRDFFTRELKKDSISKKPQNKFIISFNKDTFCKLE